MEKPIDIETAKSQLERINAILETPHLLIGGLSVQQYYKPRDSKDIDLVCESSTARNLIEKLYPSKDYTIDDKNDDEYRPSYEITHKIKKNKIIFFGPKILEREPYDSIDWQSMSIESNSFKYKKKELENIRVPRIETLAYTKLLSFLNRIQTTKTKGEQDLKDFINLCNDDSFRINVLINHIRESNKTEIITDLLLKPIDYQNNIWESSLLIDLMNILSPIINKTTPQSGKLPIDKDSLFEVNDSIKFYDLVAGKYDERNTKSLLDTHQRIVQNINSYINNCNNTNEKYHILDLGSGTGRHIATHFFDQTNISWHCVEPSKKMMSQFKRNMKSAKMQYTIHTDSLFDLNEEIANSKYDIILISFVLSSLDKNPDFESLSNLLTPNGIIIIADCDPELTRSKPYYDFDLKENNSIALLTREISPFEIVNNCLDFGLHLFSSEIIEINENEKYSFILKLGRFCNYFKEGRYGCENMAKKEGSKWLENSKSIAEKTSANNPRKIKNSIENEIRRREELIENNEDYHYKPLELDEIEGSYSVMGFNQDEENSGYFGKLKLKVNEDKRIEAEWIIENFQKHIGKGFYHENILVVNFSYEEEGQVYKGVVVYKFVNKYIMNGFWSEKYADDKYLGYEQCRRLETFEV